MNKTIFHIDVDCFFACCEEIKNPKLISIPFVVGERGKRLGIVSAANKEAKKIGIKSADKIEPWLEKFPKLKVVEVDHRFYEQKSEELFNLLMANYQCDLEIFSIDECFIDVSPLLKQYHGNWETLALEIKHLIFEKTQLIVTIGVSYNKFLAKMAGDLKPLSGIESIFENEMATKLWPLSIGKMFMVGKKMETFFNQLGIFTIHDFINFPQQEYLSQKLMKRYHTLFNYANGIDDSNVNPYSNVPKTISAGMTFVQNTNDKVLIYTTIKQLVNKVFMKLQKEKLWPRSIIVSIHFSYENAKSKRTTFNHCLVTKKQLLINSKELFQHLWDGTMIRSISIGTTNLNTHYATYYQQIKLF